MLKRLSTGTLRGSAVLYFMNSFLSLGMYSANPSVVNAVSTSVFLGFCGFQLNLKNYAAVSFLSISSLGLIRPSCFWVIRVNSLKFSFRHCSVLQVFLILHPVKLSDHFEVAQWLDRSTQRRCSHPGGCRFVLPFSYLFHVFQGHRSYQKKFGSWPKCLTMTLFGGVAFGHRVDVSTPGGSGSYETPNARSALPDSTSRRYHPAHV